MNDPAQPVPQPVSAPAAAPASPMKRAVVVLLKLAVVGVGLFFLLLVVVVVGMKKPAAGGTGSTTRVTATMTKQEWKAKVKTAFPEKTGMIGIGVISCDEKEFYEVMGKPAKTQAIGNDAFLYYQCSDGMLQLVCYKNNLEYQKEIATSAINEY